MDSLCIDKADEVKIIFFFTLVSPLIAIAGWAHNVPWMFWFGSFFCCVNLFLNLTVGIMKFPILPILSMALFGGWMHSWYAGVAMGLVVWTLFEGLGNMYKILSNSN